MSDDELYKLAESKVKARRGFYVHLTAYLVVNAFLVFIWYMSGTGYPWFLWVMAGWGIGLVSNAVAVFSGGKASQQEAIKKEYEKLKQQMKQ